MEPNPLVQHLNDIQRLTRNAIKVARIMDNYSAEWQEQLQREIIKRYSSEVSSILDVIDARLKGL